MGAQQFVYLKAKDLAVIKGSAGNTRIGFTATDVDSTQTVCFSTDNPLVAIMDNSGFQWDLNSKRVWYKQEEDPVTHQMVPKVYANLIDILYAKGMVVSPATIGVTGGVYTRDRSLDTETSYGWINTDLDPSYRYTADENPAVGSLAYTNASLTGDPIPIIQQGTAHAVTSSIQGTWDALFAVVEGGGGGGGGDIGGIGYDIIP